MEQADVPDLSKWVENLRQRQQIVDDRDNIVGTAKFFFKFDSKNSDPRAHKLMQQCVVFYAFGIECAVKSWTVYVGDKNGDVRQVSYSALLADRINNRWFIGLPDELWDPEIIYEDGKITGMNIRLKTDEGAKLIYIKNPGYKK